MTIAHTLTHIFICVQWIIDTALCVAIFVAIAYSNETSLESHLIAKWIPIRREITVCNIMTIFHFDVVGQIIGSIIIICMIYLVI